MSIGWPNMITGIAYALGTLFFGLAIGKKKTYRTWTAVFITMAVSGSLQFMYQNFNQFHGQAFWILVATTGTAGAFLFLSANLTIVKPNWKWLHWLWPVMGLLGLLVGGTLASMPNYYTVVVILICYALSALILQKSSNKYVRNWIYIGLAVEIGSALVTKIIHGDGWMAPPPLEHILLLGSNFCFWTGAKRA